MDAARTSGLQMVEEDLADVADAASMVRLRTDDGCEFVVPVQVARKAGFLEHMLSGPFAESGAIFQVGELDDDASHCILPPDCVPMPWALGCKVERVIDDSVLFPGSIVGKGVDEAGHRTFDVQFLDVGNVEYGVPEDDLRLSN